MVTSATYDAAGNVAAVTDPAGLVTATTYDALGRTTQTVADYTDGTPTASTNQTTAYAYDGDDHVTSMTAVLPSGQASQTTDYIYGVTTAGGGGVDDNDLLQATQYPDPTTGAASASQAETYAYDALGERTTFTDRNGTTHAYAYDGLGRLASDTVTAFGTGVDPSVAKVGYTYTDQGQRATATSYDASGNVVNQTSDSYDAFGNLVNEQQAVSGAVAAGTPSVGYTTDPATGRMASMTYPNGRTLTYNYGSGLDGDISRLTSHQRRVRHDPELRVSGFGHAADGDQRQRGHPDHDVGRPGPHCQPDLHRRQRHDDRRPAVHVRPERERPVAAESGSPRAE